mmetsp:Transcript_5392/g.13636  ORF Transcript_5392/g.13636 Transcript_5392/m.13636 type:complete len:393 (-) Transcript_5392:341-1519(-)
MARRYFTRSKRNGIVLYDIGMPSCRSITEAAKSASRGLARSSRLRSRRSAAWFAGATGLSRSAPPPLRGGSIIEPFSMASHEIGARLRMSFERALSSEYDGVTTALRRTCRRITAPATAAISAITPPATAPMSIASPPALPLPSGSRSASPTAPGNSELPEGGCSAVHGGPSSSATPPRSLTSPRRSVSGRATSESCGKATHLKGIVSRMAVVLRSSKSLLLATFRVWGDFASTIASGMLPVRLLLLRSKSVSEYSSLQTPGMLPLKFEFEMSSSAKLCHLLHSGGRLPDRPLMKLRLRCLMGPNVDHSGGSVPDNELLLSASVSIVAAMTDPSSPQAAGSDPLIRFPFSIAVRSCMRDHSSGSVPATLFSSSLILTSAGWRAHAAGSVPDI